MHDIHSSGSKKFLIGKMTKYSQGVGTGRPFCRDIFRTEKKGEKKQSVGLEYL